MEDKEGKTDPRVGRVYVCQPSYAACQPQSAQMFWCGSTKLYRNRCHFVSSGGSLLASTFNGFWSHALNLQECYEKGVSARRSHRKVTDNPFPRGAVDQHLYGAAWEEGFKGTGNFTHFAMLHDDIVPQDGWLDVLIEDQLATGADVVAAVSPLKDPHGLTSTAIDDPDDPYRIVRRLSMTEVMRLPEVFSASDCGYPSRKLLLNTGCWVCDLTKPWRHKVCFNIKDTVRRDAITGMWGAEVASEDWNFSRDVQAHGGRCLASRRVKLRHLGCFAYPNDIAWGEWENDQCSSEKFGGKTIGDRPVPIGGNGKPVGWHASQEAEGFASKLMPDVPGWLSDEEGAFLAELARGKRVLEIGSYCGRSSIWLAKAAREVHCVDTWDGRGTPVSDCPDLLAAFKANIDRHQVGPKVWVHQGEAVKVMPDVPGWFDLVFIDAAHDVGSVRSDIELALTVLKAGGVLAFHDYQDPANPGVGVAVDELLTKDHAEEVGRTGTVIAVRVGKASKAVGSPAPEALAASAR